MEALTNACFMLLFQQICKQSFINQLKVECVTRDSKLRVYDLVLLLLVLNGIVKELFS